MLRTPTKMRFVFLAPMFCAQYVEMPEPSAIIGCITKDSSLEAASNFRHYGRTELIDAALQNHNSKRSNGLV